MCEGVKGCAKTQKHYSKHMKKIRAGFQRLASLAGRAPFLNSQRKRIIII